MHKNPLPALFLSLLLPLFLSGQCLEKALLLKRLVYLKDSSSLSPRLQLKELLAYESSIQTCAYRNDSTHILLLQRISTLFIEMEEYVPAITHLRKAINIVSSNPRNPSIKPDCQTKNYFSLASAYHSLKKTTDKIKAYDSCIAVAMRQNIVNIYFITSLLNKVNYLNDAGEYNRCISYAATGETMSYQYTPEQGMAIYGNATQFSLRFAIQHANALLVLNRANEAEILLTRKIKECYRSNAVEYLGSLYELIAMTMMQQKKYREVISYFNLALTHNSKQRDTVSWKVNIHNIGYLIYDGIYKDDKKALSYYKKALTYVIKNADQAKIDSIITLNIYSNIANVYVRKKSFDSAQYYFQCAFNQIRKGTNETEVLNSSLDEFIENQKVEYLTGLFIGKGDAYYQQYKFTKNPSAVEEAIRVYKVTDLLLERIRKGQSELQSKLFWRKDTHRFYEHAIEACIAAGKPEDAFYFFERSRAILLYDQIKEQRWISDRDILKQQELGSEIGSMENDLKRADSASVYFAKLQRKWLGLKQEQYRLIQLIKERDPLYYRSFLDTNFIYLKDVRRAILKDHQALVELFAGDSSVYAMIITADDIYFNRINKSAYDSTVNRCIFYMSDPDLLNKNSQFVLFTKTSRYLYDLIFQDKSLPEGRVIISPDGPYFPFEALITGVEGKEPVYFLQKHAVSYTYSARFLMNAFVSSKHGHGNFMGIAPVTFPDSLHLSPLAGSEVSVNKLASFFSSTEILTGDRATKNNFLKTFGRNQIIQLYTHSSDSSSRGEPVIHFADHPLYMSELRSGVQPATKLVVLSACETGEGRFYQGEGVFSFNRAFAALGIPSCITNLWAIDNESTYRLTELFYENLSQGLAIDIALQQAKLTFIRTSSRKSQLPYNWAATIVAGKTDAIDFKKRSPGWIFPVLAIGAAGFIFVVLGFRKRYR